MALQHATLRDQQRALAICRMLDSASTSTYCSGALLFMQDDTVLTYLRACGKIQCSVAVPSN